VTSLAAQIDILLIIAVAAALGWFISWLIGYWMRSAG